MSDDLKKDEVSNTEVEGETTLLEAKRDIKQLAEDFIGVGADMIHASGLSQDAMKSATAAVFHKGKGPFLNGEVEQPTTPTARQLHNAVDGQINTLEDMRIDVGLQPTGMPELLATGRFGPESEFGTRVMQHMLNELDYIDDSVRLGVQTSGGHQEVVRGEPTGLGDFVKIDRPDRPFVFLGSTVSKPEGSPMQQGTFVHKSNPNLPRIETNYRAVTQGVKL